MAFINFLLLTIALFAGCYGHNFRVGGCPKVKVMKDFSMDQFVGDWYVIGRFNPVETCAKIFIDKKEDGVFTAEESSRPLGFNFGGPEQFRRPRRLTFLKNDTEAIFRYSRFFGPNTYGVLNTDYETSAVVWRCDPVVFGSVQNLDVLSRTTDSGTNYEILKSAKEIAEKKGIDTSPLRKVEQATCTTRTRDGPNLIPSESDNGMEVEEEKEN